MNEFDLVIVGGGVAGLAAAQYGARSNLKTLVVENTVVGGQVLNIFDLENYPGVFPAQNGADFIETMKKQAEHFGANFVTAEISGIDKIKDSFCVNTNKGVYKATAVIIATGASHRKLGVPGEAEFSGRGVSYCATCDGPFFRNKRIVVVGGGDSACDEAMYLSTLSSDVTIVHRKSSFRAQKAVADRVLKNPNIKVVFNSTVEKIFGGAKVEGAILKNVATGETTEFACDAVFIFVGMIPQTALVDMLPKDESGYIKTDENCATLIPGLYVAGDIRAKSFRQIVTATSDGAIAANSAAKYIREQNNEVYK